MSTWLKRVLICASFAVGALAVAAAPASATESSDKDALVEQTQEASNTNSTDQTADASAETYQVNVNAPIAVLSHDANNGDVNQSNEADTSATSYNGNATAQSVGQGQTASTGTGSSCECEKDGGSVSQGQDGSNSNDTKQEANSEASTHQVNVNAPIAVLSSNANNGDVDQSNTGSTSAYSGNSNGTTQGVTQDQGATTEGSGDGCGCSADGGDISQSQNGSNSNSTDQKADSTARTEQLNVNAPIAILSSGSNNGDVYQSNDADTIAWSRNENETGQWIGQGQSAESGGSDCGCGSDGDVSQTQEGSNSNETKQDATSEATTEQRNVNVPISVLSYGSNNGDVEQSNNAITTSYAGNRNATAQGIEQQQDATSTGGGECCPNEPKHGWTDHACGCGSENGDVSQTQSGRNSNSTYQDATSEAKTEQKNVNVPISVLSIGGSPCGCDGGSGHGVDQSNTADTTAYSGNRNDTSQAIDQNQEATTTGGGCCTGKEPKHAWLEPPCGCDDGKDGNGINQSQDADNDDRTDQSADATATTSQKNWNSPISVPSSSGGRPCDCGHPCGCSDSCDPCGGSGGSVTQSNDATTSAWSRNENATGQAIEQAQEASEGGDA